MRIRNPYRNQRGTIDIEIEHPRYGWIPFTASPDDPEPHGRELYEQAASGAFGPVAAPNWPDVPDVPSAPSADEIISAMMARDAGDSVPYRDLCANMADRKSAQLEYGKRIAETQQIYAECKSKSADANQYACNVKIGDRQ